MAPYAPCVGFGRARRRECRLAADFLSRAAEKVADRAHTIRVQVVLRLKRLSLRLRRRPPAGLCETYALLAVGLRLGVCACGPKPSAGGIQNLRLVLKNAPCAAPGRTYSLNWRPGAGPACFSVPPKQGPRAPSAPPRGGPLSEFSGLPTRPEPRFWRYHG